VKSFCPTVITLYHQRYFNVIDIADFSALSENSRSATFIALGFVTHDDAVT
jgi:hypothetical protein